MSYKPHFISSFEDESGLYTYYEPFLIPEKAFPVLEDAYCFRGQIKRRSGFELLGRLRRILTAASIGNTGASPWTFTIYTTLVVPITGEPYAQIQPGTVIVNINAGAIIFTDNGDGTLTSVTPGNSGTINYTTGVVVLTHTAGPGVATTITFSYYPGLPVMGLRRHELRAKNAEELIAFDQKYAYVFNPATLQFEELLPATLTRWRGTNSEFFWSTNYYQSAAGNDLFWVTNTHMPGATADPIRYYDGAAWTTFAPLITAADTLYNASIILPYKDRLLMLNTWEGTTVGTITAATNFPRRARWSQNGTPVVAVDVNAWRQDIVGRGGYLDAPTNEVIVGAEYIKDTLIVKFERSSWKLVYTGNEVLPFVFQKTNTELGSESKYSLVPFDRGVYSIANVGITVDDSVNVERIDLKIPNTVFQIKNTTEGVERVHGIRDFYNELVYWCYNDFINVGTGQDPAVFPNKVLVFNYRNNTYAKFNDSFTCFGYFQRSQDKTWAQMNIPWDDWKTAWGSGVYQGLFPDVIAGNQQGFVEILSKQTLNDVSLFVDEINYAVNPVQFTIPNHNLQTGDIIKITGCIGGGTVNPTILNDKVFKVTYVDINLVTLQVYYPVDQQFHLLTDGVLEGYPLGPLVDAGSVYLGNGVVTKYQNLTILTKVFAPFYEQGSQCRIGYVDYLFDRTDSGSVTCNVYIDEEPYTSITDVSANSGLLGSNTVLTCAENPILIPYQLSQDKIWHRQFIQAVAQNFQVGISLSDVQNAEVASVGEDIVLHALAFYLSPNARLTQ